MQKIKKTKTVPQKVEAFLQKNPEAANMLLVGEMKEIHETENDFYMIMTAFYYGYMKGMDQKGGACHE